MIEPYRTRDGRTYGEPDPGRPPPPRPAPPRLRAATRMRLAARRARNDPRWASRSPESRRLLLALDAEEEMDMARRERGERP